MNITSLQKSHIKEIIDLSDVVFGIGFLTEDYIGRYIKSHNRIGLVCSDKNKLIGYVLIEASPYKAFTNQILEKKDWFENHFKSYKTIRLIKQIAVAEEHQNKGVATQLIKKSLQSTNNLSEIICCLAWEKDKTTALKNSLIKNGFNYHTTINDYWKKDSIDKNYSCAYCGFPPCECSTKVYIKKNAST